MRKLLIPFRTRRKSANDERRDKPEPERREIFNYESSLVSLSSTLWIKHSDSASVITFAHDSAFHLALGKSPQSKFSAPRISHSQLNCLQFLLSHFAWTQKLLVLPWLAHLYAWGKLHMFFMLRACIFNPLLAFLFRMTGHFMLPQSSHPFRRRNPLQQRRSGELHINTVSSFVARNLFRWLHSTDYLDAGFQFPLV